MKTLVLNLYGGPGTGKSTTAALVFAKLKQAGFNAELVREYVKEWAWEGRHPGVFDQFYFFGKQSRKESLLYGKVDVIVTDCPVMLGAFYADKYSPEAAAYGIKTVTDSFYRTGAEQGISHLHIFLERSKPYNAAGRYQTEDEAKALDGEMKKFLRKMGYTTLKYGTNDEEVDALVEFVKLTKEPSNEDS